MQKRLKIYFSILVLGGLVTLVSQNNIWGINMTFRSFDVVKDYFINRIAKAENRILVITSVLASTDIATALILADYKGVTVRVLVNKTEALKPYSRFDYLKRNVINVKNILFKGNFRYSVIIIDNNTYKLHSDLSKKTSKKRYWLEIVEEKETTDFFVTKYHNFYISGTVVDPGSFLFQLPNKRLGRKKYVVRKRNKRLPQLTILQRKEVERKINGGSVKSTIEKVKKAKKVKKSSVESEKLITSKTNTKAPNQIDPNQDKDVGPKQPFELEQIKEKEFPDIEIL